MTQRSPEALPPLYERDETLWLEIMAELVAAGRYEEIDARNLSEYLADMARRDRREVKSRLIVLLTHLLKWRYQPEHRTNSWQGTILTQQQEMQDLLESGTLRNHAAEIFAEAYQRARRVAAAETGLPIERFPEASELSLDQALTVELS